MTSALASNTQHAQKARYAKYLIILSFMACVGFVGAGAESQQEASQNQTGVSQITALPFNSIQLQVLADTRIAQGSPLEQRPLKKGSYIQVPVSAAVVKNPSLKAILENSPKAKDGHIVYQNGEQSILDLASLIEKQKVRMVSKEDTVAEGVLPAGCDGSSQCRAAMHNNSLRALRVAGAAMPRAAQRPVVSDSSPSPSTADSNYVPAVARTYNYTPYRSPIIGGFNPNSASATFRGRVNEYRLNGAKTSLIDAPENPYSKPQEIRNLIQDALINRSWRTFGVQRCWPYVRDALIRSGMVPKGTDLMATTARERVRKMEQNAGFTNIINNDLRLHPEHAPVGSVIIYGSDNPGAVGDVQIRTEHGYVSDFFWPTAFTHQSGGRGYKVIGVMVKKDQ